MSRSRLGVTALLQLLALVLLTGACSATTPRLEDLQDDPMAHVLPEGAREVSMSTDAGGRGLLGKDSPAALLRTLEVPDGGEELFDTLRREAEDAGWAPAGELDEQLEHVVALFTRDPGAADNVQLALTWDRGESVLIALTGR